MEKRKIAFFFFPVHDGQEARLWTTTIQKTTAYKLMKKKIAFIGLGVMGFPMAGHLAKAGFDITVYNRTPAKALSWLESYSGQSAETPKAAAESSDIACICVGNDDDVRSVVYGQEGVLAGMKPNTILIDHTTASATLARELSTATQQQDIHFLDAPVSGGQVGAEKGLLTIMVGGEEASFQQVEPVLKNYAKAVTLMGENGAGQLTKMVNQICIAGLLQGLSEGLNFAQKAGLDGEKVVDVISKGAAQSWQLDNRGKTMVRDEFDFGFAVDWMRKDLSICIQESQNNQAQIPITEIVKQYYDEIEQMQGGRWDTSSLIRRLT